MAVPKVGDKIYVDDWAEANGGLATVSRIEQSDGFHLVGIKEVGGVTYNWEGHLESRQDRLRKQFGSKPASR